MNGIQTRVGNWIFKWASLPRGQEGIVLVEAVSKGSSKSQSMELRWRRDSDGIRLILPQGVYGFDLQRVSDEEGRLLFDVTQRGSHLEWAKVPMIYGETDIQTNQQNGSKKTLRLRAQMPGQIVRVMVTPGQTVEKGQPVILMEAMKMENEIRAPEAGKVSQVKVTEGQAVETGADLVVFEP